MADAATQLSTAASELEQARKRVDADGEDALRRCQDRYRKLLSLLDSYEDTATGSGDFQAFTQFQGTVASLVEELDDDIPERETFEAVDEYLQQRRLTKSDFDTARKKLEPVRDRVALLEEWEDARERYSKARRNARQRLTELDDRIAELERLERLSDADLDAPVERLREPIGAYDEAVQAAFSDFRSNEPARAVLSAVERAEAFPLVDLPTPPPELLEYVRTHEVGSEPIPTLLEYADYSTSKLDHYVDDTAALKRAVSPRRTYLRRLDAEPLAIGWPPPPADHLPWLCREYRAVLSSFAEESVVAKLRAVRQLTDRESYTTLRESALARAELDTAERERVASGAVTAELQSAREERATIESTLEEYGPL